MSYTVIMEKKLSITKPYLYAAWATAFAATLASIYFIEVKGNPAASLCWFERMLMFGTLLVLTVGILKKDRNVPNYVFPFLLSGIPAAIYQQLIHWNFISVEQQSCSISFICTTKYFNLFGFITQATLCLTAFLLIGFFTWKAKRN